MKVVYVWIEIFCISFSTGGAHISYPERNGFQCYENIKKKLSHGQQTVCESDSRVKNATCFLCGIECKSKEDINAVKEEGGRLECDSNKPPITISCCLQAQMLNEDNSTIGKYNCYGGNLSVDPQMDCPFGRAGSDCQDEFTEPVDCLCIPKHSISFGLNNLSNCREEDKRVPWSICRMSLIKGCDNFVCRCIKTTETDVANTRYCSTAQLCKVTGGSQGQFSHDIYIEAFVVFLAVVIQRILRVVKHTYQLI